MKICEGPACDREVHAKGLCRQHYNQMSRGKELTPIRKYRRAKDGMKQCSVCEEVKPLSEFYVRTDGAIGRCITCGRRESRERHRAMAAELAAYRAGAPREINVGDSAYAIYRRELERSNE